MKSRSMTRSSSILSSQMSAAPYFCTRGISFLLLGWMFLCGGNAFGDKYRKTGFSDDPAFQVLDSSNTMLRVLLKNVSETDSISSTLRTFVAVPMTGEIEFSIERWVFSIVGEHQHIAGTVADITPEERNLVTNSFKEAMALDTSNAALGFHDLRVLQLQVRTRARITRPVLETAANCIIDELEFVIRWPEMSVPRESLEESKLTDTFDTLKRYVLLNYEQAQQLRTRPPINDIEPKLTDPLWLRVVGHQAEGPMLHGADRLPENRPDALRIMTSQRGLYQFRGRDLHRDHIDLATIDTQAIVLWRDGHPIPHQSFGLEDNRFEMDDRIVFYAEPTENPYSRFTVTWMSWSASLQPPEPQLQSPPESTLEVTNTIDAAETTLHFEEDRLLAKDQMSGYRWVWKISSSDGWLDGLRGQPSYSFPLTWPGLVPESELEIRVLVLNRRLKPANVHVQIGDRKQSVEIRNRQDEEIILTVPGAFVRGDEKVQVNYDIPPEGDSGLSQASAKSGDEKSLFLDWADVNYMRRLDLSDGPMRFRLPEDTIGVRATIGGTAPGDRLVLWEITAQGKAVNWSDRIQVLDGGKREVVLWPESAGSRFELAKLQDIPATDQTWRDNPSTLLRQENQADILFIAYSSLMEEARRLMNFHARNGVTAALIDVQDIYDEFNGGAAGIDAIKQFLKYTQCRWQWPIPQAVVLIGDANWDHRDNQDYGILDQIPVYTPPGDPQDIASDEWYTELWGTSGNDELPDLILGRIAVREAWELQAYIDKVIQYETDPPMGWWRARNLFIADDTFERDSYETTEESLPLTLEPTYINQIDFPYQTNPYLIHSFMLEEKFCPACTEAIVHGFNEGAALLQYFGHGGAQLWSHERIFWGSDREVSDVLQLDEVDRWPFVINWSCNTGKFNFNMPPFYVSLAEELIRHPKRGAISVWAPTHEGTTEQHQILAHNLLQSLSHGARRVGTMTQMARIGFWYTGTSNNSRRLVDQYVLVGDPLVSLAPPRHHLSLSTTPAEIQLPSTTVAAGTLSLTVHGQAEILRTGKASVRLYDKTHQLLLESPETNIDEKGRFEVTVLLPALRGDADRIIIRAYAYDPVGKQDESGGITIPAGIPDLAITEFQIRNHGADGGDVHVQTIVANKGFVASEPTSISVHLEETELNNQPVAALAMGATEAIDIHFAPNSSLRYLSAQIVQNPQTPDANPLNNSNSLAIVPPSAQQQGLAAAVSNLNWEFDPYPVQMAQRTRVKIPVETWIRDATIALTADLMVDGATVGTQSLMLLESGDRSLVWEWLPKQTGTIPLGFHLRNSEREDEIRSVTLPVEVVGQPDVVIVTDSLRSIPLFPTVGHTSYITMQVANLSETPVRNVRVMAEYQLEDSTATVPVRWFKNKSYNFPVPIEQINGGEVADVTIQWDDPGLPKMGNRYVTIRVDDLNTIYESDETNNSATMEIFFQDLPDMVVSLWGDHGYKTPAGFFQWGDPIELWGRVSNMGGAPAERARLSFKLNGQEIPRYIASLSSGAKEETQVSIPAYFGYNVFELEVDRFDLISEKNEQSYRTGQKGNNLSKPIALDLTLIMPPGKEEDGVTIHEIRDETHFSAGIGPLTVLRRTSGMTARSAYSRFTKELQPENVTNPEAWTTDTRVPRWYHDTIFSCFRPPQNGERPPDISFKVFAPNGDYNLAMIAYGFTENASAEIRLPGWGAFKPFAAKSDGFNRNPIPLGPIRVEDGCFEFTVRAGEALGDIGLYSVELDPVDTSEGERWVTYDSALFPVPNTQPLQVAVAWEGLEFEGSQLRLRGRFWDGPRKNPRSKDWSEPVSGESGTLNFTGQGRYVQWRVEFVQQVPGAVQSILKRVIVRAKP